MSFAKIDTPGMISASFMIGVSYGDFKKVFLVPLCSRLLFVVAVVATGVGRLPKTMNDDSSSCNSSASTCIHFIKKNVINFILNVK